MVKEIGYFLPLPWGPPGLSLGIHHNVGSRRGNSGAVEPGSKVLASHVWKLGLQPNTTGEQNGADPSVLFFRMEN